MCRRALCPCWFYLFISISSLGERAERFIVLTLRRFPQMALDEEKTDRGEKNKKSCQKVSEHRLMKYCDASSYWTYSNKVKRGKHVSALGAGPCVLSVHYVHSLSCCSFTVKVSWHLVAKSFSSFFPAWFWGGGGRQKNLEVLYWSQWGSCPLFPHPPGAQGSGLITGRPPWS